MQSTSSCGFLLLLLLGAPVVIFLVILGAALFLALTGPAIGNVFSNITIGI